MKDKTNPSKEERCTGYVRENVSPPALFAYMGRPAMTPDSLRTPIVRTGARGGGSAGAADCRRSGLAETGLPGQTDIFQ
ncbi:hypothetical protein [Hornefia butyriciproducens]|uniref:hypothetical protein n=1 Tax=Hornefia butyriciproducens TaxID=2652293 RepID=UPI003F8C03BD